MKLFALFFCLLLFYQIFSQKRREPIIDMHMHANHANFAGTPPLTICIYNDQWPAASTGEKWPDSLAKATLNCKHKIVSPSTDDEVMNKSISIMQRYNVYGVISGRLTEKWKNAAPDRFITSLIYRADGKDPSVDSARKLFASGKFKIFGELMAQYNGVSADDSSLAPYWALAEELSVPVGIHIGPGPIGAVYLGLNNYKASLHSPLQLEVVLKKHPRLRVYIMHAAWPMIDELLVTLWNFPQVHVDISGIITDLNNTAFYNYLKQIVEAGFIKRIMFGSDQMIWPEFIEESIKTIEKAPFLNKEQKRDILNYNAARFLNLSDEEMKKHYSN
jgi:predicted TIM-barrel fold metal-dependent hydrolase